MLAAISISFDPHTLVIFTPLMTGASIALTEDGGHRDGMRLSELLNDVCFNALSLRDDVA